MWFGFHISLNFYGIPNHTFLVCTAIYNNTLHSLLFFSFFKHYYSFSDNFLIIYSIKIYFMHGNFCMPVILSFKFCNVNEYLQKKFVKSSFKSDSHTHTHLFKRVYSYYKEKVTELYLLLFSIHFLKICLSVNINFYVYIIV